MSLGRGREEIENERTTREERPWLEQARKEES